MDIILRHAKVDNEIKDIGIKNGIISKVESVITEGALEEIELNGSVVIPGFVDAHLHLDKSMINEWAAYRDVSGPEKGELTRQEKEKFTVEDIELRAEQVIKHAIKTGTLFMRTNVDVDDIVELKGIEALIRLREKYKDLIAIQITAFSQEGFTNYPKTFELLREAVEMGADLVGGHTIVDGEKGKEHIDKILSISKEYNVPAEFHVDESGNKEHYLLPYLCKRILDLGLKEQVTAIHNCTLSSLEPKMRKEAYRLMKKAKIKAAVAPTAISTRQLAPVKEIVEQDIPLALGSDNVRDFFNPLGSGDVKQVALLLSYIHRFYKEEEVNQIWDMITSKGAQVLGIENYEIKQGGIANLTIFGEKSISDILAKQSQPTVLIRKGQKISNEMFDLDTQY